MHAHLQDDRSVLSKVRCHVQGAGSVRRRGNMRGSLRAQVHDIAREGARDSQQACSGGSGAAAAIEGVLEGFVECIGPFFAANSRPGLTTTVV